MKISDWFRRIPVPLDPMSTNQSETPNQANPDWINEGLRLAALIPVLLDPVSLDPTLQLMRAQEQGRALIG